MSVIFARHAQVVSSIPIPAPLTDMEVDTKKRLIYVGTTNTIGLVRLPSRVWVLSRM